MRRFAIIAAMLALPAHAGGPVWEDMIASSDPGPLLMGAIFACANATTDPTTVADVLAHAGWQVLDAEVGTVALQKQQIELKFGHFPGFCKIDTAFLNTDGMADFLTAFGMIPTGTDASGCAQFMLDDAGVVATLTGGGNDPTCISDAASSLSFGMMQ